MELNPSRVRKAALAFKIHQYACIICIATPRQVVKCQADISAAVPLPRISTRCSLGSFYFLFFIFSFFTLSHRGALFSENTTRRWRFVAACGGPPASIRHTHTHTHSLMEIDNSVLRWERAPPR